MRTLGRFPVSRPRHSLVRRPPHNRHAGWRLECESTSNSSLCNLCVLCVSVVHLFSTTETQRTQRLHREVRSACSAKISPLEWLFSLWPLIASVLGALASTT